MPATNVSSDWVNGNLVIYDKDKDIIATVDGTNGYISFPSGGLVVNGTSIGSAVIAGVTATAADINILDGATITTAELNKLASAGDIVASGTQNLNLTALKANYVKTDIDDAGTIDGTELAVVLNLLAARINALDVCLEAFGINAAA